MSSTPLQKEQESPRFEGESFLGDSSRMRLSETRTLLCSMSDEVPLIIVVFPLFHRSVKEESPASPVVAASPPCSCICSAPLHCSGISFSAPPSLLTCPPHHDITLSTHHNSAPRFVPPFASLTRQTFLVLSGDLINASQTTIHTEIRRSADGITAVCRGAILPPSLAHLPPQKKVPEQTE